MEHYSAIGKNEFKSVLVRCINLKLVIQSEVSQKEKNKYINANMESRKMILMNLFAGKEWRRKCTEWTCRRSGGGREWDKWRK